MLRNYGTKADRKTDIDDRSLYPLPTLLWLEGEIPPSF